MKFKGRKPEAEPVEPPNIPEVKINGEAAIPAEAVSLEAAPTVEPEDSEAAKAVEAATLADQSRSRLMEQIAALRQAEDLQRQHQAQLAQIRAPSREDKLAYWQQAGMPEAELRFLEENPSMIDHDQIAAVAAQETMAAGIGRESPEFLPAVKENFEKRFRHLQAQGAAQSPEFFKPRPAPERSVPDQSYYVSAPVTRQTPTGSPRVDSNPTKIRLSAEEKQIAAASGISEVEYAKNKIELERQKRTGQIR